jgi:PPOX class probable F420-dependent enzyme
VTPIWFLLDNDGEQDFVMFTTGAESVKGRALRRDPRFGMAVDDQAPPYSFVSVEGEAELLTDLDEMLRWATLLGGRYMGGELAEQYGKRNAVPGEYLVRGRITRVTAHADVAD